MWDVWEKLKGVRKTERYVRGVRKIEIHWKSERILKNLEVWEKGREVFKKWDFWEKMWRVWQRVKSVGKKLDVIKNWEICENKTRGLQLRHCKTWVSMWENQQTDRLFKKIDRSNGRLNIVPTWSKLGPKVFQKLDAP